MAESAVAGWLAAGAFLAIVVMIALALFASKESK